MKLFRRLVVIVTLVLSQGAHAQDIVVDLGLTKSTTNETVQVGDTVEFTLTMTNFGPDAATGIILQDILPSELTFVTASHPDNFVFNGSMVIWNFGLVEVGLPLSVTFQATVNGPAAGGSVTNSATVSSNEFDPLESNNFAEVMLTVTGGSDPVDPIDTGVMVQVDTFCIDKYEASLQVAAPNPNLQAVSLPGVLPAVNISQVDAEQACREAGKRLCTSNEWLRACQSSTGLVYPYGNALQPGTCNDGGTLANTGEHPDCVTVEGAVDMVGNVNEWTDDPSGTARGGFFADIAINGLGCLYRTTAHNALHSDAWTGFRCCAEECVTTLQVAIDIKPGSDPNCFNVNGHGVIPVAILGSDTFDVTNIDYTSLLFGGLEVRIRGKKGPLCGMEDSNGDAYLDLVCHFEDDADNWSPGSESATLTGVLLDGNEFAGTDSICVVP